ncbi:putative carbonic anhydrase, Monodehydroascorbate reductase (NADH) [Helianthus anomalus]
MCISSRIRSLLVLLIVLFPISIYAQEVQDEREFDYDKASGKGPEKWGKIHKEWSACNNGKMQSPIDLSNKRVDVVHKSKKLLRNYKPSTAVIINRGHDIEVRHIFHHTRPSHMQFNISYEINLTVLGLLLFDIYKLRSRVKCHFSLCSLGHFVSLVQRFHFSSVG